MPHYETERIKKLKAERAAIDVRLRQELEKQSKAERDTDRNRKIVAGACVLQWAKRDSEFSGKLMEELKRYTTRDRDRALFGLPLLKTKEN